MSKSTILIGCAVVLCSLSACSPTDGLIGPCATANREGPNEDYKYLALSLATKAAWEYDNGNEITDENERIRRIEGVEKLRRVWVPTLKDACLQEHADKWLVAKLYNIKSYELGSDTSFERRRAEQERKERALAEKLGIPYR